MLPEALSLLSLGTGLHFDVLFFAGLSHGGNQVLRPYHKLRGLFKGKHWLPRDFHSKRWLPICMK